MNLIKDLTIGKKLSFSFGFLLLIVLLLGIFWQKGILDLKDIEVKKSNLIELKDKLREMQLIHYKWVDNLREAVRKKSKFEGELDPLKCGFGKWYYSYELPYPELEGAFKALASPHEKFHQSGVAVVKAMGKGDFAEAENLSLQTREVLLPGLMKFYESFMMGINVLYDKYNIESLNLIQRQRIISASIASALLIIVIILAILLTRSIVLPLRRVTATAKKIAEGDLPDIPKKEIDVNRKDEIAQMEDTFTTMAASLSTLSKTAERIATGDLNATVKIRSEKDVLGKAISKMVENLKQSLEELHTNSMNLALGMSDYFSVISELSLGNLNIKASEDTEDDLLNQLGKVTNNMIGEYKKLADCIKEVRLGNLEVKVPVRSDKDSLGIGFEHMIDHLRKTSEELHSSSMNLAMSLTDYFFILQQVAAGDLTVRANEDTGDDLLNQLGIVTNLMISSLEDITITIREQSYFLASSSNSIVSVLKQSTRAISELSSTISLMLATSSVAESSNAASTAAQEANISTQKGSELMFKLAEKTKILQAAAERSVKAMKGLSTRSSEIGKIVNVITKIASQTNLLALNAAIVAAGAGGEAGQAFAVVADEVHNLAESSANSARDIAKIIKEVLEETEGAMISAQDAEKEMESGAAVMGEVNQQFTGIALQVENIVHLIENIASSTSENVTSAERASSSSQEQTEAMQELAASATELSDTAEILKNTVARFKVR